MMLFSDNSDSKYAISLGQLIKFRFFIINYIQRASKRSNMDLNSEKDAGRKNENLMLSWFDPTVLGN